jgi:hypothetical protein
VNRAGLRHRTFKKANAQRRPQEVRLHLAAGAVAAAPRRKKKIYRITKPIRHSSPNWARTAIGLLVFLEILLLAGHAIRWVTTSPRFILRTVDVVGHQLLDPNSLVKLAGLAPGTNLFGVNLEDVRKRIESNPWIRRTSIRKVPPSTLRIEIEERRPAAFIRGKGVAAVDREGIILGQLNFPPGKCLPLLEGFRGKGRQPGESIYGADFELALRATILFEGTLAKREECPSIRRVGKGRILLQARGGKVNLLIGEEGLEAQAARYRAVAKLIFRGHQKSPVPIQLDLTFPGRIVVRPLDIDGGLKG